jgi:hypothetical protein
MVREILGYLNFSSGASDAKFLRDLNQLFGLVESGPARKDFAWQVLAGVLRCGLAEVHEASEAFREVDQAEAVLDLVFDGVLPAYREFHRDLLFRQTEESLYQPFFIGRVCEAVLAEGPPWNQPERIVPGAVARLNDFIGHRPVAVLRTAQKIQPYAHEWVRPIPLYVRDAGVAVSRYRPVVERAIEILRSTSPDLRDRAWFDPALLDELAVDPRAYDFDHPVNRRPNYHFGGWDPHNIDNRGHYRRYVLQQVTLDALWSRVETEKKISREEILFEAAAVLAGTILMGSGITGNGPETHDSSVSLATLLPHIAAYRDIFYEELLGRLAGPHGERLKAEAKALRQPFGAARQHLNQSLARRRAEQLQHVHLARLFARMGFMEAAIEQAQIVPVAAARMRCEIDCRLTAADLAIQRGEPDRAAAQAPEIEDLLHRAIECGAMVDPWNILGFGGQFSKFPAVEDSIHDHRVDELIELMNEIFGLYARLEQEAAARGNAALRERLSAGLHALAQWWDRFASTEVGGVEGVSGREAWESAGQVSEALRAWHQAGTAADNVAFWQKHVQAFRSPKAFALLVDALLKRGDLVAAMALLVHWLSQAEEIPLAENGHSFHALAIRWMGLLWENQGSVRNLTERWSLARKLLDYMEANADAYWQAPHLELAGAADDVPDEDQEDGADGEDSLFSAAYENVTYRDTSDDGFEGEMLEGGMPTTDLELARETERIGARLAFLSTVARLWKQTALASSHAEILPATSGPAAGPALPGGQPLPGRDDVLAGWLVELALRRRQLGELLASVHRYRIPAPRGTHESLVEFDRRRGIKEMLLEQIIAASVEMRDAELLLRVTKDRQEAAEGREAWETAVERVLRALVRGDVQRVRADWQALMDDFIRQPLLYLPIARGGSPQKIVQSRSIQQVLRRLLVNAPRMGLLTETYRLLGAIQQMEREHPAGPGAITEFDRLFEIGCAGILQCLVDSSAEWRSSRSGAHSGKRRTDRRLIDVMEKTIELLLRRWLSHSRNVRISVLETVNDRNRWRELKQFIQRYGHDLFSQKFMNFSNLRAILHQRVENWLRSLEENEDPESQFQLLEDLDGGIPRAEAARWLELTIEAVVENYSAYVDYNSTTTQSDRGEMLYTLLDFLRVEASYDRVAWNLRPVVIAHDVLVRAGRAEAAELWRQMVAQRSGSVADEHVERLERLMVKYGMRLPSIVDRIGERFVKPLAVDRLAALVRPAMEELRAGRATPSFDVLQEEIQPFTREPSGIGFDVPAWLEVLEAEVFRIRSGGAEEDETAQPLPGVPLVRLPLEEIQKQIAEWDEDPL